MFKSVSKAAPRSIVLDLPLEYKHEGKEEISSLGTSLNRMRRSLVKGNENAGRLTS